MHGTLANIFQEMAQYEKSIASYQKSLDILRETVINTVRESHLAILEIPMQIQYRHQDALDCFNQSLSIAREIGNEAGVASKLGTIAIIHQVLGNYDEAIANFQLPIEMTRKLGHKRNQGLALGNLGGLFVELKRFEEAEPYLLEALELCQHTFPDAVGVYCGTLAWMYAQQANITKAFHYLTKGEGTIKVIPIEYGQFM